MKKLFTVIFVTSLFLNAYLLLSRLDLGTGGGIHRKSPNDERVITVQSLKNLNPLATNNDYYARITIRDGYLSGDVIREFMIKPIQIDGEMEYRYLRDAIRWSENSNSVTVTTPDFSITANLKPEQNVGDNAIYAPGQER